MRTTDLDAEACISLVRELVGLEGRIVFTHGVEARGMASGGSSQIYRWKDWYFRSFDESLAGPFDTLDAALDEYCTSVFYMTQRIECSEWTVQEILRRLSVWPEGDPSDPDRVSRDFTINGEPFTLQIGQAIVPRLRAVD